VTIFVGQKESGLSAELKRDGFSVRSGLESSMSITEVAQRLGSIIDVQTLLPSSGIPTVQSLRPRDMGEVGRNQYSGHYGFGTFPVHTDLAHWALPPLYLLLRSVVGADDVFTHVLPWEPIVGLVGAATLRTAVFASRKRKIGCSGLVRAMSHHEGSTVLRWDPIFLTPVNQQAHALASTMLSPAWNKETVKILLHRPGDTIIIDNWRMLHGRGRVSPDSKARHIDRVYLSKVF
jgi:L-asparagine oxygenase